MNFGYIDSVVIHDLDAPFANVHWNFQFGIDEASLLTMGATF